MIVKLYTTSEVAEICRVTPYTVRQWLMEGKLAGVKQNSKYWRVTEDALTEFLKEKHD